MEKWSGTGKIKGLAVDYTTGRQTLSFELSEDFRSAYDELSKCDKLSLEIGKYRARRSLNANSYFHVLVGKIADVLGISKTYCKNILITRYGQQEFLPDGTEAVIKTNIPPEDMMELEEPHCLPCGTRWENGKEIGFYKIFRGSHTYNTKEMSTLIDGTVQEAKDLGIETLTPDQLEEMKQKWHVEA